MSALKSFPLRWGLGFVLALVTWFVLIEWVSRPLHAAGHGQAITGYLHGLDLLLMVPGRIFVRLLRLDDGHTAPWILSFWRVFLSLPFYFWAGYQFGKLFRSPQPESPHVGRRRFLTTGLKVAGGGMAAGLGYSLILEPRWFSVTHHVVPLRDLPPELNGLRAVQLTDIHHGPWFSTAHVREVVRVTNDLNADLIFLTGDYVSDSPVYVAPVIAELAALRARIGTVAILGNHDWWHGGREETVQREFERVGIPLLDNTRRILAPERRLVDRAEAGLCIAGVGDLWCDEQDYGKALGGLSSKLPRVLLAHNPDVAEEPRLASCGHRVDVQLSGHTHGGQIWVPGLGTPVVPSQYGQKYAQGWVDGPVSRVFVCRGLGMSILPLRCGVRPEIAVFEFRSA